MCVCVCVCVWGGGGVGRMTRVNEKRSMLEEHTSENTNKESSGQIRQHNHKSKETRMLEDPEDASSEGLKSNAKDH